VVILADFGFCVNFLTLRVGDDLLDGVVEDFRNPFILSLAPHPLTMANSTSYWSLDPCRGKQTGLTFLVYLTGEFSVRMAMSLLY
jgi:hypothetical protein